MSQRVVSSCGLADLRAAWHLDAVKKNARTAITKAVRDAVLEEYDHRCALCGSNRPQLHHVDEDRSNSIAENLIPLCPNCHLTDQHNPTRRLGVDKLRFFRKYKDLAILSPQFDSLLRRMRFIQDVIGGEFDRAVVDVRRRDFLAFVEALEMGAYFSKKLRIAITEEQNERILDARPEVVQAFEKRQQEQYASQLRRKLPDIHLIVVELLKFQPWLDGARSRMVRRRADE